MPKLNIDQPQAVPLINPQLVRGLEATLNGSPFLQSYVDMRSTVIQSLKLPPIGSLVSIVIENPHLNIVLEESGCLVGCNIKNLENDEVNVYPNTSATQKMLDTSLRYYNRNTSDEDEFLIENDYIIELYGMVFDYTFEVDHSDSKVDDNPLMVHLITNPFTPMDGNHIKIGCIIAKDEDYSRELSVLPMQDIVKAFRPVKSF